MRALRLILIALLLVFAAPGMATAANTAAPLFASEAQAQQHCPKDTVVWLNTKSGVYHFRGQRWYGRTKDGAYVCLKEAPGRATLNGQ